MKVINVFIAILITSVFGYAQNSYSCYEYQASRFYTTPSISFDRVVLAVPSIWPEQTYQPLILLFTDKTGRRKKLSQYIECQWKKEKGLYRCGGECDAGEVILHRDMSMELPKEYSLNVDIPVEMYAEEERAELHFKATKRVYGKKVKCPPYAEQFYDPVRDGENMDPLLSVCYDSKKIENGILHYQGCQMRNVKCSKAGKMHFGHYKSTDDAYQAFLRCLDSTPKKR